MNFERLKGLGFSDWFLNKSHESIIDGISIARVTSVNKNNYKISDGERSIVGELSGKFLFNAENSLDYPAVGDWVIVEYFDDFSQAIIHGILPRKTLLKRRDPGKAVEYQLVASNIDYAIIMQSADSDFNLNRLERYLVMVNESGIEPMIVLSKTDLISDVEILEIRERIKRLSGNYKLVPISNITDDGIKELIPELKSGMTYCLLGSSGVGKSSLLNKLIGESLFEVSEVREKDSKGRHTTSRRQLTRIDSGSIFIDTPGMRELGNIFADTGLETTFDEISDYGKTCRFSDCTHTHEKGCAVIEAVEKGIIDGERYNNYLKLRKESEYYQMSYLEKRNKDKALSKVVKNYKKIMRKK